MIRIHTDVKHKMTRMFEIVSAARIWQPTDQTTRSPSNSHVAVATIFVHGILPAR